MRERERDLKKRRKQKEKGRNRRYGKQETQQECVSQNRNMIPYAYLSVQENCTGIKEKVRKINLLELQKSQILIGRFINERNNIVR